MRPPQPPAVMCQRLLSQDQLLFGDAQLLFPSSLPLLAGPCLTGLIMFLLPSTGHRLALINERR